MNLQLRRDLALRMHMPDIFDIRKIGYENALGLLEHLQEVLIEFHSKANYKL